MESRIAAIREEIVALLDNAASLDKGACEVDWIVVLGIPCAVSDMVVGDGTTACVVGARDGLLANAGIEGVYGRATDAVGAGEIPSDEGG